MTGTAETEAPEFAKIYNLDVVAIPTNRPLQRIEEPDLVYRTEKEKYEAIVSDILEKEKSGRPTLVGTVSIEKSERLSQLLQKRGIKHVVLNAKHHAREAEIVAQAGRVGTVTIATNMAGRGTDILLGGSAEHMARQQAIGEEVAERLPKGDEKFVDDDEFVYFFHVDAFYRVPRGDWERIFGHFQRQSQTEHDQVISLGGLHILGTERHEARRIDNQLRGRAGRQGDPGSSRFYLSLEDDLMRIFGSDRISGLMQRLGMEEGVPIEHGMVTRAIERAQKQVEGNNFSTRKHLLEYDDVMNKQRESVYTLRREILEGKIHLSEDEVVDTRGYTLALAEDLLDDLADRYIGKQVDVDDWDVDALKRETASAFGLDPKVLDDVDVEGLGSEEITDQFWTRVKASYEEKERQVGPDVLRSLEKQVALNIVDVQWKDHLYSLDHLKEGIGLRGYGQRDPLVEYKKESFSLFQDMRGRMESDIVQYLFRARLVVEQEGPDGAAPAPPPVRVAPRRPQQLTMNNPGAEAVPAFAAARGQASSSAAAVATPPRPARSGGDDVVKTVRREEPKVGRNDPCPCGSGKKYKKCHGAGT
jgi:preprotein translocase subunit SecA